jgi:CheY-like chemotaxis protein
MTTNILIAEDYDDNRELLRVLLSGVGYEITEARDGNECLSLARKSPPDLIMVDLSMPGLDGWGVFKELRADANTTHIPCIAVTAHTDRDCNKALETGFDAFVGKPFRTDEMLATVRRVIAQKVAESKQAN